MVSGLSRVKRDIAIWHASKHRAKISVVVMDKVILYAFNLGKLYA